MGKIPFKRKKQLYPGRKEDPADTASESGYVDPKRLREETPAPAPTGDTAADAMSGEADRSANLMNKMSEGSHGGNNVGTGSDIHSTNSYSRAEGLKTANTYKLYVDNSFPGKTTREDIVVNGNNAGFGNDLVKYKGGNNLTYLPVALPWKIIPNNDLRNYIRAADWELAMADGAVGYNVKKLHIKFHGVYQMSSYPLMGQTADIQQQQSPPYLRVFECQNGIDNYTYSTAENNFNMNPDSQILNFGDCHSANKLGLKNYNSSVKAEQGDNSLRTVCYLTRALPATDEAGNAVVSLQGAIDWCRDMPHLWYPDLDKKAEHIKYVANGEDFEWTWENPDDEYIAMYEVPSYKDGRKPVNELGVQNMADHADFHYKTQYNYELDENDFSGFNQIPNRRTASWNKIKPLLVQVPDFPHNNDAGSGISHKAYMYATYEAEVDFIYSHRGTQRDYIDYAPTADLIPGLKFNSSDINRQSNLYAFAKPIETFTPNFIPGATKKQIVDKHGDPSRVVYPYFNNNNQQMPFRVRNWDGTNNN